MFGNITKKGVLIVKGLKKDGVSLLIRGKGRGLKAKLPVFFLPRAEKQGRGRRLAGVAKPGGQGLEAAPG